MPRKTINYSLNCTYSTVSHCLFDLTEDQSQFMKQQLQEIIQLVKERYLFTLGDYSFKKNKLYLAIQTVPQGAPVNIIIQYIKSRLAERMNRKLDRCGPFWMPRYKCIDISQE